MKIRGTTLLPARLAGALPGTSPHPPGYRRDTCAADNGWRGRRAYLWIAPRSGCSSGRIFHPTHRPGSHLSRVRCRLSAGCTRFHRRILLAELYLFGILASTNFSRITSQEFSIPSRVLTCQGCLQWRLYLPHKSSSRTPAPSFCNT